MDGFFLSEIDGHGIPFDQREPSIGLDQEVMRADDLVMDLQGGVVIIGVVIDRGILMTISWHFHPAGSIPGLLNDNRIIGGAAGVVVEYDGIREAGRDDFRAAEGVVAGLWGWLLPMEKEEDGQDEYEDGRAKPEATERAAKTARLLRGRFRDGLDRLSGFRVAG